MANDYYTHGSFPATGSSGSSSQMRAELDQISQGFDKLPSLSSNAYKLPFINSGATGITVGSSLYTDASGNLGVGTASPAGKLDVNGAVIFRSDGVALGSVFNDAQAVNLQANSDATAGLKIGSSGATPVVTYTNGAERMRVDSSGNVGIGTSTPAKKLHVAGDIRVDGTTTTSASAGTNGDVPAQVAGYLVVNISGVDRKIPYYA